MGVPMQFELKNEYRDLEIQQCGFSNRTHNILMRNGITNVYDLIIQYNEGIRSLRGAGVFVEEEIEEFLSARIETTIIELNERDAALAALNEAKAKLEAEQELSEQAMAEFLDRMDEIDVYLIPMNVRVYNGLKRAGINTVKELLLLKRSDLFEMRNIGAGSVEVIEKIQDSIWQERDAFFTKEVDEYEEVDSAPDGTIRDFDLVVIADLRENFEFSTSLLCEWFNITRQRVYQKLDSRKKNRDKWIGKPLTSKDIEGIKILIYQKSLYEEVEGDKYYLFNNKKDDCVFLCVSEEEIKCFYLKDLPEALQEKIRAEKLEKYDSDEMKCSPMGEIVYILKEPYLKPFDMYKYRLLAQRRGMSLDEYAQFVSGVPYYAGKNITDDQIIAFLEENLVDGKVYISSDASNHWFRSYASRNGYSTKAFVEFYGYETTSVEGHDKSTYARQSHIEELKKHIVHDNVVYLDTFSQIYRTISVYAQKRGQGINEYIEELGFRRTMLRPISTLVNDEADMEEYIPAEDAKLAEKIFARNPLLGSYVFSEKNMEALNKNAKTYVDKLLSDSGAFKSPNILKAELQIALAVINYAKNWASEEESSFWNFMAGQFGYRDNSNEIRDVLCRCIEDSMRHQKRLFLSDSNGNQYKSTIVVHAMTTKKTWMYLYDFLFDFYKNNLNWTYMENDPSIGQMVRALSRKLDASGEDGKDESISISSDVYRFQEGIRKLVLYRPKYTEKLFGKLIKRLDEIIKQEASPAKTYEEVLADEWIAKKMQKILETKTKRTWSTEAKDIAISYDRIRAVYQLENETDVKIVLPDIRLKEEDTGSVTLQVFYEDKLVNAKGLSFYGNELGRTIHGVKIDLKECQRLSGCNSFDFAIRISCGESIIYDSENTLYRSCITFDKKTEINPTSITKGNYTIVIPRDETLEVENAEVNVISEDVRYGNYYYVQFGPDFVFTYHDQILAIDNISNEAIRVMVPHVRKDLTFVQDGLQYKVASSCDVVRIIMSEDDIQGKYVILLNGERIGFDELESSVNGTNTIYDLPVNLHADKEVCKIQILDLNRSKLVLNEQFIIAENVLYEFNRLIYFSAKDFENASFKYSIDNSEPEAVIVSNEDEFISAPYAGGEFIFSVPRLRVYDSLAHKWGADVQHWIETLGFETFLKVDVPEGINVQLLLDDRVINPESDGSFGLGNVLHGSDFGDKDNLDLKACIYIDGTMYARYRLASIAIKERFITQPKLVFENGYLKWDRGYGFVGRKDASFNVSISSENGFKQTYPLDLESEIITENVEFIIGEYKYVITKDSGNIFMPVSETITEGSFFVGDANELRFLNHRICIGKVSFYDNYTDRVMQTEIVKICIDKLCFIGTEEVGDDGELPIYSGTVFFENKHGERKEFSDTEGVIDGVKLMKVNPVRVALLNDTVLSLVDFEGDCFDEGDGFYCYSFRDKDTGEIKYSFTDREYVEWNKKFYRGVDLYMYKREKVD